jgi:hypothetical protein
VSRGGEFPEGFDGDRKIPGGDVVPVNHVAHHGQSGFIVISVEVVEA